MKKITFFLLFISANVLGQGINNLWMMGYDCCSPGYWGMNLDFSTGNLVIDTVYRNMNLNCTNGVICNKNGQIIFYSNGIYISNALDDTMLNGEGLNPGWFTNNHSHYGLTIPQANLIIPFPDDSLKYYLFHETADDYPNTYSSYFLYYSIIDMSLDSGKRAVVQKNTVLLNDTLVEGRLTACKHANGRDWWLVSNEFRTGRIYKFLVTANGILGPDTQNLQTIRDNYFGQAVFSVQGDKYVYYEPYGDLDIFDFDRCTGDFLNRLHIDINDSAGAGGAAFSPSGRYLYIPSMKYVYQFDMLATDIEASKVTVAVWDTFYAPHPPAATVYYLAALAPDNKIYINCSNSTDAIHVINYPDSAGLSCGFCQHCIQLPALNAFTIPNYPNYFLGRLQGSVCDSLTIDVPTIFSSIQTFNVFPNPARNIIYITPNSKDFLSSLSIFNSIGRVQAVKYLSIKNGEYVEVDVGPLTPGIYFIEMQTGNTKIARTFIKE